MTHAVDFPEIFLNLHQYINILQKCTVTSKVKLFPWDTENAKEVYEGGFVISDSDEVTVNNQVVKLKHASKLNIHEIKELFRSWTQDLQLKSIKTSVRDQAKICVEEMETMFKLFTEELKSGQEGNKKVITVMDRIKNKQSRGDLSEIQIFITETKQLRDGVTLKELSQEEAAKRLAIGTQQGKYHNKAIQKKGIEDKDFVEFKEKFKKIYTETRKNLKETTSQEPSFYSMQTQKDVLLEDDIIEAISSCNQYEFVENFPLVGLSINLKRTSGSMINPFLLNVVSFAKINKVCDTVSLLTANNEM